jgi:ABC-type transport system involved in Fe-S cluster assembly fused permease/ATPase subunit
VITIAHRLTTIRDASQIIVVRDGDVADNRKHNEVMANNGIDA